VSLDVVALQLGLLLVSDSCVEAYIRGESITFYTLARREVGSAVGGGAEDEFVNFSEPSLLPVLRGVRDSDRIPRGKGTLVFFASVLADQHQCCRGSPSTACSE